MTDPEGPENSKQELIWPRYSRSGESGVQVIEPSYRDLLGGGDNFGFDESFNSSNNEDTTYSRREPRAIEHRGNTGRSGCDKDTFMKYLWRCLAPCVLLQKMFSSCCYSCLSRAELFLRDLEENPTGKCRDTCFIAEEKV